MHLKKFRLLQRAPAINPFQSSCDFSSFFCGQRFGSFESTGDISHGEGVLEGFQGARGAIMREIQKIGLVNSVWNRNIEFRSWNVPPRAPTAFVSTGRRREPSPFFCRRCVCIFAHFRHIFRFGVHKRCSRRHAAGQSSLWRPWAVDVFDGSAPFLDRSPPAVQEDCKGL